MNAISAMIATIITPKLTMISRCVSSGVAKRDGPFELELEKLELDVLDEVEPQLRELEELEVDVEVVVEGVLGV